MAFIQAVGFIIQAVLIVLVIACVAGGAVFVVEQQQAAVIERLGKFHRIAGAGIHVKVPFIDRIVHRANLRTMSNAFAISAKTADNVTIKLAVSAQYRVDLDMGAGPADSGVYKSYYMLADPVRQMSDYIADALRSAIPQYDLDDVFAKKDAIANDVNATVSAQMERYGFVIANTLITDIALPPEVEASMNRINSAQRERAAAQDLAEADRIKRVTQATAEAEAMEKAGEGIASQRKAIAEGIKESLDTIKESGVTEREANMLFTFTQWTDMMAAFAKSGKSSTAVLPSDFKQTASMFEQMLAAQDAGAQRPE